ARFGTDCNQADQLFFDQLTEVAVGDERLQQAAKINPEEKYSLVLKGLLETLMLERMDQNEAIVARYMNDPEFKRVVDAQVTHDSYRKIIGEDLPARLSPAKRSWNKGLLPKPPFPTTRQIAQACIILATD